MSYKPFLLSFTATALLVAPFVLQADAPPQLAEVRVAPGPGQETMVNGVTFHSVLLKHDAKTATLQVTAQNPSASPIQTEVVAELMMRPSTSPMARMVPPPRELASSPFAVGLAPGEKVVQTITVKLPADVAAMLATVEAPKSAAKNAKNAKQISLDLTASPPSLYTMVRERPAPVKAQRVSTK